MTVAQAGMVDMHVHVRQNSRHNQLHVATVTDTCRLASIANPTHTDTQDVNKELFQTREAIHCILAALHNNTFHIEKGKS